jgi:hypothetical protein
MNGRVWSIMGILYFVPNYGPPELDEAIEDGFMDPGPILPNPDWKPRP